MCSKTLTKLVIFVPEPLVGRFDRLPAIRPNPEVEVRASRLEPELINVWLQKVELVVRIDNQQRAFTARVELTM